MCVIFACSKTRPTAEQIKAAYSANPRGAGIAWRETVDGEVVAKWKKGMNSIEAVEMAAKVPLPFVIHFRIPSVGPDKPEYNHPFPISANAELDLEGTTKGNLLFHNGTWGGWRQEVPSIAKAYGIRIPFKEWSDSRAMAFAAYCASEGILSFIDERVVAFGPDMLEIFSAKSWSRVAEGFWASNMGWSYAVKTSYTGSAADSAKILLPDVEAESQAGGAANVKSKSDGIIATHVGDATKRSVEAVLRGGNQQERVQSSEESLHAEVETRIQRDGVIDDDLGQKGFRAWIAKLQPSKFKNVIH